ncbi:MAG: hypothetical protein NTY10_04335 [Candidatus Omnitrophica bacterium]|nr:hypothetical protein [Candidatus Omnitrophota bacterium]
METTIRVELDQLPGGIDTVLSQIVEKTLEILPGFIEETVKPKVVSFCPTPEEEAEMLSKDSSGVGSTEWGRFIRNGADQLPIREAIMAETPHRNPHGCYFGDAARINSITKFSWERHFRGKDGRFVAELIGEPTSPFDYGYSQALENGGSWTVVPRVGRKHLYPEKGVLKTQMVKTLQARQMFLRTVTDSGFQSELISRIKRSL